MLPITIAEYERLSTDELIVIVKSTLRHIEEDNAYRKIIGKFTIDFKNNWLRMWFNGEIIAQWRLHYFIGNQKTFNYLVDSLIALF